jgi:hypothetical protein
MSLNKDTAAVGNRNREGVEANVGQAEVCLMSDKIF